MNDIDSNISINLLIPVERSMNISEVRRLLEDQLTKQIDSLEMQLTEKQKVIVIVKFF